ncbi:transmembrane emp24 domain-containing protein p24delta3-like [Phragmites australis]|uniref:transmembrane emp24 domain-containing protein p24delta3-like n=1 Tax=Phragmites australis TaxID=29695 RepID=UPI002D7850A8|nr:transmembrane emp24 domain-containing protein p24delta3-like [Phragmites australis]
MAAALALSVAAAALAVASLRAEAVWLDVPQSGTKCVSEEIQSNVVVLADYSLMYESHPYSHPTIAVKVTSPYGNTLHHNENATLGQFAFTTTETGNYLACFWIDSTEKGSGISVNLDWKIGIATKDWDAIAKKEKIEGVELELQKLEVAVEAIHQNLIYLKAREAEMRTVSEKTNARVAWFSILSLGVCIAVSVLQLWHLQGYFRKKKLI